MVEERWLGSRALNVITISLTRGSINKKKWAQLSGKYKPKNQKLPKPNFEQSVYLDVCQILDNSRSSTRITLLLQISTAGSGTDEDISFDL